VNHPTNAKCNKYIKWNAGTEEIASKFSMNLWIVQPNLSVRGQIRLRDPISDITHF